MSSPLNYLAAHRPRFVRELRHFVRFPSVSADPKRAPDVRRCAEWLARHLSTIGLDRAKVISTARHPIVYAEWRRQPHRPTLTIYGHYDVQPEDPVSAWRYPPFSARVIGNELHGRGASDDKGQLFAHVKALECVLRATGKLPVNVRCLFEGEEEVGSSHLIPFLERNAGALRTDAVLMSDMRMLAPDKPTLAYSVRGQLGLELHVQGQRHELHSGNFGGGVHNPIQALCEILSRLHTPSGRIAIPHFYDDVRLPPARERSDMRRTGPDDRQLLGEASARHPWGEPGYNTYERLTIRPALTLNGITGGYQGPGGKAVIPTTATAKLSFRLVPDQDPERVDRLFRDYVRTITPPTVSVRITRILSARPAEIARDHPALRAAVAACRIGFNADPAFIRLGGSIPVIDAFSRILHAPTVLLGLGLPDDRIHAPNEKFDLRNLDRGIKTSIAFLQQLSRVLPAKSHARPLDRHEVTA